MTTRQKYKKIPAYWYHKKIDQNRLYFASNGKVKTEETKSDEGGTPMSCLASKTQMQKKGGDTKQPTKKTTLHD